MSVVETRYEHIVLNEAGEPAVAGTTTTVLEIAVEKIAYGWNPEEMVTEHPYLTLGQVSSALAYYADHQEELDAEIEADLEYAAQLEREAGPSPLVERLREQGLL